MENRSTERFEELPTVETPEDVAVLYSWANLHGAKYRDFSASRREYRAQLRHRAAEQAREQELRAQASAETAATFAERAVQQAEEVAMSNGGTDTQHTQDQARQEAEAAARVATAERIEAARRAEAAALAQAAARREQLEIAEASASARRQAAQYAESELRRRQAVSRDALPEELAEVPGEISDPYTPQSHAQPRPAAGSQQLPPAHTVPDRSVAHPRPEPVSGPQVIAPAHSPAHPAAPPATPVEYAPNPPAPPVPEQRAAPQASRRPQGYRPDDASGVRQIYRGPEFEAARDRHRSQPARQLIPVQDSPTPVSPVRNLEEPRVRAEIYRERSWTSAQPPQERASAWSDDVASNPRAIPSPEPAATAARPPASDPAEPALPAPYASDRLDRRVQAEAPRWNQPSPPSGTRPEANLTDPTTPRRRRQDSPEYKQQHPSDSGSSRRRDDAFLRGPKRPAASPAVPAPEAAAPAVPEPSGPAWLYATVGPTQPPPAAPSPQASVADTLQQSRERVAARWYALKGVFEQPGQEQAEPAPVRQKETRTPILAVFSMAGGVGKTSLVATLGRSLSSLGEKVLLTDTTSHGLLPFYFGASELRQGTVRTFSPPSGSTDAPIYLVSYDVEGRSGDDAAQDALIEEITGSSRGTHRVLLDLSVSSGWIVRCMARLSPTVLVPVAPDMNSVISLSTVEKFFDGILDPEGRPLKLFYLLNQFDASLPLHLDVREVLRRQLGDRLLPFVIRRAPAVSEALAEGMTIVDYSPEAPVAEDYLNAATWLRTVAAPATAGFRNVRWSER